jgi:ubiquinone/menaquinone biosynthesis C-methylase UbiE
MRSVERFLAARRKAGRRTVFIVDTKCGDGNLLIRAAMRARALGFLAIEATGLDRSPEQIVVAAERARALAGCDPAIGFHFLVRERGAALPVEDDGADLMLAAPGEDDAAEIARAVDPAGAVVDHP